MTANLIMAAQAAQGSSMSMILMMVAIFAIMYFFMIRPQQKKQKEIQKFQNSLAEGAQVVTGGGIYGTVKKIDLVANIVEVEIARGVVVRVDKGYVFKDMASTPVQGK
ncbi:MAG: preprotein translocase subunit YajC [Prevotella sp.]|jgi:preprotein translocase subunit YajC|nr:preprotein translocase subunit YajC [Prevotella sp.]MDO4934443.1 preprotein translocase subunit YajC [Prevotella sp.]